MMYVTDCNNEFDNMRPAASPWLRIAIPSWRLARAPRTKVTQRNANVIRAEFANVFADDLASTGSDQDSMQTAYERVRNALLSNMAA